MKMEMEECGLGLLSAIAQHCVGPGVPQMDDDAGPARLAWSRSHFSEDRVEGRILKRTPSSATRLNSESQVEDRQVGQ
jgi:hypothetical protein